MQKKSKKFRTTDGKLKRNVLIKIKVKKERSKRKAVFLILWYASYYAHIFQLSILDLIH